MPRLVVLAVWLCCVCGQLSASSDDAPFLGGMGVGRESFTGAHTATLLDRGYVLDYTGSGPSTWPLPACSAVGNGYTVGYFNSSTSALSLSLNGTDTFLGPNGTTYGGSYALFQGGGLTVVSDGAGVWKVFAASGIPQTPFGFATGDLSGSYPNPTVAKVNGVSLGATTATSGNLLIGSGSQWVTHALTGPVSLTSAGVTALATTGVTAASYTNTNLTVGADGRITAAASGSSPVGPIFQMYGSGGAISNTTGPTDLAGGSSIGSRSVASATWYAGKQYRLNASGTFTMGTASSVYFTPYIGTTALSSGGIFPVTGTAYSWFASYDIICLATGVSGSVNAWGVATASSALSATLTGMLPGGSGPTINLTSALNVTMEVGMGVAAAGNTVTCYYISLTPLN